MIRFCNGVPLISKRGEGFKVRIRHLGNGHAEASIYRPTEWQEAPPELAADLQRVMERDLADEDPAERDLANRERAARRAKSDVRHKIKSAGLDALLTLTYQANEVDLARCKGDMKEFVRRIRRVLPRFTYVAAFERQKRGAWHVHMAIHRLPQDLPAANGVKVKSYSVVRAIWRSVVGDRGGNIDQQARKRWSKQTAGKLAAYVSKYMVKAFEDGDKWSNRYSGSRDIHIPPATLLEFRNASLSELVALVFDEIAAGACQCTTWLSDFGDCFFLSTERPPDRPAFAH